MAAPVRVVTGATAVANDLNQLIDLLEGASSLTEAFKLVSSSGENFIIKLADAAGARKFSIQDSAGVEVASIDSDGSATFTNVTSSGNLVLPTTTSPSQTTDGQVFWDSDDNLLTIGDGASRQTFYPDVQKPKYKYKTANQDFTDATLTTVTATSGNMQWAVAASTAYMIQVDLYFSSMGGGGTDGVKFAFTLPAAPTYAHCYYKVPFAAADQTISTTNAGDASSDVTSGVAFAANNAWAVGANAGVMVGWTRLKFIFINGTTAGNVVLQVAQNTNGAGTTTIAEAVGVIQTIQVEA